MTARKAKVTVLEYFLEIPLSIRIFHPMIPQICHIRRGQDPKPVADIWNLGRFFRFHLTDGTTGGINLAVKPTQALRQFFSKHLELRAWSTQLGLAQAVDRSESLLRSVEAGRMEMSPKFARALSSRTGVAFDWLMKSTVDPSDIPAADGGQLEHEVVIARIKSEIERNLNQAERDIAAAAKLDAVSAAVTSDPAVPMKRRMAAAMAKLVEDALFESLSRGETGMMDEITKILAKEQPTGLETSE